MTEKRTHSTYAALPPLPLPGLEETCARYGASVRPLVDDATHARIAGHLAALQAPEGLGRRLQAALERRAAEHDNWLAQWWDDVAYLAWPEPLLINSNFGISCDWRQPADDPCERAAEVVCRTLDFHRMLLAETLPPETVGREAQPLDMSLFRRLLATSRLPGLTKDRIESYGPEVARHIVVMRKNRFYTVETLDGAGGRVSVAELTQALREIVAAVDAEPGATPPIAALTTERRPTWAMERERLRRDPMNARTLNRIESAILAVCLDEEAYDGFDATARAAIHGKPGQRWMDKVFSYVVDAKGRVSQHGEHSPADGMQFVSIFDHGCDKAERGLFRARSEERRLAGAPKLERLGWRLSTDTLGAIEAAAALFERRVADLDLRVLHFDAFGKGAVKPLKTGPDPFVQMAFQLGYWRMHRRTPKTYESAQTRMYRLGRTETIRSATADSRAFTTAWDDPARTAAEKTGLLRAALETHGRLGREAAQGFGCDRHMLGLALMAAELGEPAPALFAEEIHGRGWELSTAQLPMTALLVNGFGPVCPQGYGIGYVIQEDTVTAHVTSWRSDPETSSGAFAHEIARAMTEMRTLMASQAA